MGRARQYDGGVCALIDPARGTIRAARDADLESAAVGQIDDVRLIVVLALPFDIAAFSLVRLTEFGVNDARRVGRIGLEVRVAVAFAVGFRDGLAADAAVDRAGVLNGDDLPEQLVDGQALLAQVLLTQAIMHPPAARIETGAHFRQIAAPDGFGHADVLSLKSDVPWRQYR